MTLTCAEHFAKKTNFAVTLNCAMLQLLQCSWLQTPVQKRGV